MSAFYSFLKCLSYTANRHRHVWKISTQVLVFKRLDATSILSDPLRNRNLFVWIATNTIGLIAYFTSRRCKVRCADESRGTRWDGQKNEVITFSRDAKINTAGSTSSSELHTALLFNFEKTFSVFEYRSHCLISRKCTWQLSEKLIHNSITQSKASRSIMAAMFRNYRRLLHHTQYARSRWCIVQCPPLYCNTFECTTNLMIVGLLSTALFQ